MDGKAHSLIGAGVGFGIAYATGADYNTAAYLIGAGVFAGLAPDLDTNGKLANKITLSSKLPKLIFSLIGLLLFGVAYTSLSGSQSVFATILGLSFIFLAAKFSQKAMLIVTGVAVSLLGVYLNLAWPLLLGVFIVIAALLPHRSYTHSVWGLVFFGVVAYTFNTHVMIDGMFVTLVLGYASHLLADSRFIPGNKMGVKFLMPISTKQF